MIDFHWPQHPYGLQGLFPSRMVDIDPSGGVFLAAEGLEVVAHRGGDMNLKFVFLFVEHRGEVVDAPAKILYAKRLSVDEHLGNAFDET